MHRLLYPVVGGACALSLIAFAAWAMVPEPGHMPLHIGCGHSHGPVRTAGEGRRLLDARALNRQARELRQQQAL